MAVDLRPNAGMATAAAQGLAWNREGLGGDGLVEATIVDARKMAAREPLSAPKVRRMPAWFARHEVDLQAAANSDPNDKNYPGPGRVAWQLWGGDAGRRWSESKLMQLENETNRERRALTPDVDVIICDIDGTLLANGTEPIQSTIDYLAAQTQCQVVLITGRPETARADTVAALDAAGVAYADLLMNRDDGNGPEFKSAAAQGLIDAGVSIMMAIDNDPDARVVYADLGIEAFSPDELPANTPASEDYVEEPSAPAPSGRWIHASRADLEVRESGQNAEALTVRGYAAVFDQPSQDLGGFREYLTRGAFDQVLAAGPDVHLVIGHDMAMPLARTANGSLEIKSDERGLAIWARIDPRLSYANDLALQLRSGLVDQMSFAFTIPEGGDTWEVSNDGKVTRTVSQIDALYDVSIVAAGAYPQTNVQAVRALLASAAERGLIPNLEDIPRLSAGDEIVARPTAAGDVVEAQPGDDQSIRRLMTVRAHARMALLNYPKRK